MSENEQYYPTKSEVEQLCELFKEKKQDKVESLVKQLLKTSTCSYNMASYILKTSVNKIESYKKVNKMHTKPLDSLCREVTDQILPCNKENKAVNYNEVVQKQMAAITFRFNIENIKLLLEAFRKKKSVLRLFETKKLK